MECRILRNIPWLPECRTPVHQPQDLLLQDKILQEIYRRGYVHRRS